MANSVTFEIEAVSGTAVNVVFTLPSGTTLNSSIPTGVTLNYTFTMNSSGSQIIVLSLDIVDQVVFDAALDKRVKGEITTANSPTDNDIVYKDLGGCGGTTGNQFNCNDILVCAIAQGLQGDPGIDGIIQSIVEGANILVDNSDPANPVVSSIDTDTIADGSETIVNAGTNVTVTGTGTPADPYIVNTTGGADGSETIVNAGTNVTVTGVGTPANPYIVNSTDTDTIADGSETIVNAGTNVTVTGTGTPADPYIVNTTGGADGSETIVNAGTNVTVTGVGTPADPYIVNSTDTDTIADGSETIVNAGTNVTVTGVGTSANPYIVNSTDTDTIADGSETIVNAGTNVTVTGVGTSANPYIVSHTDTSPLVAGRQVNDSCLLVQDITINNEGHVQAIHTVDIPSTFISASIPLGATSPIIIPGGAMILKIYAGLSVTAAAAVIIPCSLPAGGICAYSLAIAAGASTTSLTPAPTLVPIDTVINFTNPNTSGGDVIIVLEFQTC